MLEGGEDVDWRVKEALMYAIGTLKDKIWKQEKLKGAMEDMLIRYILPELGSAQPFLRQRAC